MFIYRLLIVQHIGVSHMNRPEKLTGFVMQKIIKSIADNNEFVIKATALNQKRQQYISYIAVPASLACLIIFAFFTDSSSAESIIWRNGILVSHVAIIIFMTIAGILSRRLIRSGSCGLLTRIFQYISATFMLLIGLIITVFDQLVISGITPFLIASIVMGFAYLIRPLISTIMYFSIAVIMLICLGFTQADPDVLLSNQVNGIAVSAIGLILSVIIWKSFVRQARQEKYIQKQQTELETKNAMLDQLASFDSLTGLKNRRAFQETVRQEFARVKRNQVDAGLIIMDLDHFKNINDKYGHPTGDKILIQIAGILQQYLRDSDSIARWGGEEFALLLPETDIKGSCEIAERVRDLIAKRKFAVDGSEEIISLTASFGVAELSAGTETNEAKASFEKAYRHADRALYKAKLNGRNRVEYHKSDEKYYQQISIVG